MDYNPQLDENFVGMKTFHLYGNYYLDERHLLDENFHQWYG